MKTNKPLLILWKIFKTIIGVVLGLVIFLIIFQRVSNNRSLFGKRIFTVASGSMEPKYKILDMLLVTDIRPKDVRIKDDIVYLGKKGTYKDKIVTHQVINIEKKDHKLYFHTQGIANPLEDPLVSEDQIYGKVIYKFKILSFLNKILNHPIGFIFLIVLPIAILFLLEALDLRDERVKINEE